MIVRAGPYLEAMRQAGRAEALDDTIADLRDRLSAADKENRRLTTAILRMREQHFELGPETFDDRWPGGKYVMGDVEQEVLAHQPVYTEHIPGEPSSDEDAAAIDREFEQELNQLFAAED